MELPIIILMLLSLVTLLVKAIYKAITSHIDWYEELTKPSHKIEWDVLAKKAVDWRTCAIAVHYKGEKNKYGVPVDQEDLVALGIKFHRHILYKNAGKALRVLHQIEMYKPKKVKRHSF